MARMSIHQPIWPRWHALHGVQQRSVLLEGEELDSSDYEYRSVRRGGDSFKNRKMLKWYGQLRDHNKIGPIGIRRLIILPKPSCKVLKELTTSGGNHRLEWPKSTGLHRRRSVQL